MTSMKVSPVASVEKIYAQKPNDIEGTISYNEAHFLHESIMERRPGTLIEVGMASGLSTAIIANAVAVLKAEDQIDARFDSVDFMARCYFDTTRPTGFFVEEYTPHLLRHVNFRRNATVANFGEYVQLGTLEWLFIDANHKHPWPALDFLVSLPSLKDDAVICFHDTNLPIVNPNFPDHGVKYVFDAVDLKKKSGVPNFGDTPNIGSVELNGQHFKIRSTLMELIQEYAWEIKIDPSWLKTVGLYESIESCWKRNNDALSA